MNVLEAFFSVYEFASCGYIDSDNIICSKCLGCQMLLRWSRIARATSCAASLVVQGEFCHCHGSLSMRVTLDLLTSMCHKAVVEEGRVCS